MTTAKCASAFLQCLAWLVVSLAIAGLSVSFSTNGCIVVKFNINTFVSGDMQAKHIAGQ